MALVVRQHLMLCLLKGPRALSMVIEVASLPLNDYAKLHNILISLGLHSGGKPL
jgi:hypothetical protein